MAAVRSVVQSGRRVGAAVIACGAAVVTVLFGPPALAGSPARLSVHPDSGPAGAAVTIRWGGFAGCSAPVVFTWDGGSLTTAAGGSSGSVSVAVPSGALPGTHIIGGTCRQPALGATATFRVVPGAPTAQPTTAPPVTTTTERPSPTTTTTTTITTTTTTSSATTTPPRPPATTAVPIAGTLSFDRPSIQPGDPVLVSGSGCPPGAAVQLTSGGQPVGQATADRTGTFRARVEFTRVEAGPREVVADCGIRLSGFVEQFVSSTNDASAVGPVLVLVLFALAGFSALRVR